jgi:hypothetical protein
LLLNRAAVDLDVFQNVVASTDTAPQTVGYGGCFMQVQTPSTKQTVASTNSATITKVCVSQPGGRIWCINTYDGEVEVNTHNNNDANNR